MRIHERSRRYRLLSLLAAVLLLIGVQHYLDPRVSPPAPTPEPASSPRYTLARWRRIRGPHRGSARVGQH